MKLIFMYISPVSYSYYISDPDIFLSTSCTLCLRSFVNMKHSSYFILRCIHLGKRENHLNEMGFYCESCDVLLAYLMLGDIFVSAIFYNLAI